MRIAVVGPLTGGSVSVAECTVRALRRLGHDVRYVDNTGYMSVLSAIQQGADPEPLKSRMVDQFLDLVRRESRQATAAARPQLALHLAQAPVMRDEDLEDLRRADVPTVLWFVEDAGIFTGWRETVGRYDHFWTIQGDGFVEQLLALGQRFADHVPLACDPDRHHPRQGPELERYRCDVSFVGSHYPNRVQLLQRLKTTPGLQIYGPGFARQGLAPQVRLDGTVPYEQLPLIFSASRINLNLTSAVLPAAFQTRKDFLNPRAFEICGCAGFQLIEDLAPVQPFFEPGQEVVTFDGVDDARDKIAYYLAHDDERLAIAAAGHRRAHAEHSYDRRLGAALARAADRDPRIPR